MRSGVQFDEMGADERTGFGEAVFFGHCAGAAGKAPGFPQRPGGDVVGPAGLPRDLHRQLQQSEQPRLDFDRPLGRGGVDLAQFAVRTEDRQLVFQLLDLVEGFQGGFRRRGDIARRRRQISNSQAIAGRDTRTRYDSPPSIAIAAARPTVSVRSVRPVPPRPVRAR